MVGFFERLLDALEEKGLIRADLCRALEISEGTVRNWKKGVMPAADTALKIANYLNVNAEWLITGETPRYKGASPFELSPEKREILDALDIFDQRDKEDILSTIRAKKERYKIFVFDGKKKAVRDC